MMLLSLLLCWLICAGSASADPVRVPADAVSVPRVDDLPLVGALPLLAGWRFRSGHAEARAARDFDDSGWMVLDSLETTLTEATRERIGWTGEGWFRLRLHVDPGLPAGAVGLLYGHSGALAIYLDGLLLDTSGRVASRQADEQVYLTGDVKRMTPLTLTPGAEHVIAVHFSNRNSLAVLDSPDRLGFATFLVDLSQWGQLAQRYVYTSVFHQTLFVVPLAFGIFHLLLFLYHRRQVGHLYYALFALSVSVLIYAPLHLGYVHALREFMLLRLTFKWALLAVPLTALLFLYTEFLGGPTRLFKSACVLGVGVGALAFVIPLDFIYYVVLLFFVDVVRVVVLGLRRDMPGTFIVRAGWFVFAGGCLLQVLMELSVIETPGGPFVFFPYIYGTLILVVSMSVYLARAVGRTNRELEDKLEQVSNLSARALEHEREVQSAKLSTLTHLVAGIVHEMNSPVGAIRSARDTLARAVARLREGIPSGPALQAIDGATSALESATDRLGTILSGFKSFSHLDEAEWQIARLEEGLDSTVALMDSQLQGQITVEKEYGGIPAIWCTPARLNQVFMHLITNALQAMDGPGTLRLRTWVEDDRVCVGIRDSGVGIPAEQLGGLFDVAFRRRARVKMGMGLVADSHTVSEHGGKMHVHSKVGVGTEVIIRLPLRQRE